MTLKEILATHPAPWSHTQLQPGVITTLDAAGQAVPLFTLLDFVAGVTAAMVEKSEPS